MPDRTIGAGITGRNPLVEPAEGDGAGRLRNRPISSRREDDDVNGNYRSDFADVVLYFNQVSWIAANKPITAFDYNNNGRYPPPCHPGRTGAR